MSILLNYHENPVAGIHQISPQGHPYFIFYNMGLISACAHGELYDSFNQLPFISIIKAKIHEFQVFQDAVFPYYGNVLYLGQNCLFQFVCPTCLCLCD